LKKILEATNAIIKEFLKASDSHLNEFPKVIENSTKKLSFSGAFRKHFLWLQTALGNPCMTAQAALVNQCSHWNRMYNYLNISKMTNEKTKNHKQAHRKYWFNFLGPKDNPISGENVPSGEHAL
jgi:hypothetical protein